MLRDDTQSESQATRLDQVGFMDLEEASLSSYDAQCEGWQELGDRSKQDQVFAHFLPCFFL